MGNLTVGSCRMQEAIRCWTGRVAKAPRTGTLHDRLRDLIRERVRAGLRNASPKTRVRAQTGLRIDKSTGRKKPPAYRRASLATKRLASESTVKVAVFSGPASLNDRNNSAFSFENYAGDVLLSFGDFTIATVAKPNRIFEHRPVNIAL